MIIDSESIEVVFLLPSLEGVNAGITVVDLISTILSIRFRCFSVSWSW